VAARVCLLGPCVVASDPSIPVFGAGALAVVVGLAVVSWEPPPFTLRVVAGGGGHARVWLPGRSLQGA
jgi:hypothetical protein